MDMWVGNVQDLVLELGSLGLVGFTTMKNTIEQEM